MKGQLRSLLYSSFDAVKHYRLLRLHLHSLAHGHHQPVLLYQMGKVGSTSVLEGLRATRRLPLLYHLHSLRRGRLRDEEATYRRLFRQRRRLDGHLLHALLIRRILDGWPPAFRSWKIVTMVRDPVARNLSTFFQTLDFHHAGSGLAARIREGGSDDLTAELREAFLQRLDHRRAVEWFDDEIRHVFGVDILAEGFDPERGYGIYSSDDVDVLLIRLEDLDRCAEAAIRDFLDLEVFRLPTANVGAVKYYGAAYRNLSRGIRLPPALLDDLYNSRMVRTLYSQQEIADFRARWSTTP